jgi:hypothetical protein
MPRFACRDKLRLDLKRKSQHWTTFEKTSIEDRRRKLEGRVKDFNEKAKEFIGNDSDEDVEIQPQYTGWEEGDKEDDENENESSESDWRDEEDNQEEPETSPIWMPSSFKQEDVKRFGLATMASQELELRKGQANDCLQSLRLALGHKAVIYRTKVRKSNFTNQKTRAWDDIKASEAKVNKHVRAYRRARAALKHLGADNATLSDYQMLQKTDLRLSADITEENRMGQRSDTLPWFWRMKGQNEDQHNAWMQECEFAFAQDRSF